MKFLIRAIRGERAGLSPAGDGGIPDDSAESHSAKAEGVPDSGCIVGKIGLPVMKAAGVDRVMDHFLAEEGLLSGPVATLKHAGDVGLRLTVGRGGGENPVDSAAASRNSGLGSPQ